LGSAHHFREVADGLEVFLRVTPRASANRMAGSIDDGEGGSRLKILVTAVPEGGKANKAVILVLAKAWKLAKSHMEITSGETARNKTVRITGDAPTLVRMIEETLP
jgi:uncharacterized protein